MTLSDYKGKLVMLRRMHKQADTSAKKMAAMMEIIETVRIIRKIESRVLTVKGTL